LSSERILVRSDSDIKRDVEDELKWDPEIMDPTDIAVSVKDGVVTLAGFARRYIDKWEAEWAAKRVQGVVGIALSDNNLRFLASTLRHPQRALESSICDISTLDLKIGAPIIVIPTTLRSVSPTPTNGLTQKSRAMQLRQSSSSCRRPGRTSR